MSYQVNFHSFLIAKDLQKEETDLLQSTAMQAFVHEELVKALMARWPNLMDKVQIGQGRTEVCYLGL